MALIKCPECGKEVSSLAVSCPNCGCPIKKLDPSKNIIVPFVGWTTSNLLILCVTGAEIISLWLMQSMVRNIIGKKLKKYITKNIVLILPKEKRIAF